MFYLVKPPDFPRTSTLLILHLLPSCVKYKYQCVPECPLCTALCPAFSYAFDDWWLQWRW